MQQATPVGRSFDNPEPTANMPGRSATTAWTSRSWRSRRRSTGSRPARQSPSPWPRHWTTGLHRTSEFRTGCRPLEAAGGRRPRHRPGAAAGPGAGPSWRCLSPRWGTSCAGWPSRSTSGRNTRRRSNSWLTILIGRTTRTPPSGCCGTPSAHPGDFWLNYDLAHTVGGSEGPRGGGPVLHGGRDRSPAGDRRAQQPRASPTGPKEAGRSDCRLPPGPRARPELRLRPQQPRQRPA